MKVGRKLISWDTTELVESYLAELKNEVPPEVFAGREVDIWEDASFFESEWEYATEYLTDLMEQKKQSGYWRVKVNNFGWRNLQGEKVFTASTGSDLLSEILPKTDCTFKVFNFRNGFAIQNWHHDSPTGNEWYYVTPIKYGTYVNSI